jgi:hypothetical protein
MNWTDEAIRIPGQLQSSQLLGVMPHKTHADVSIVLAPDRVNG